LSINVLILLLMAEGWWVTVLALTVLQPHTPTTPQPGSIFGGNLAENAPSGFDRGEVMRISGQEVEEGSVQTRWSM
jgi:hypothetical protein